MYTRCLLGILLPLLWLNLPVEACRFNVRDVGMVDFAAIPYKLYCFVDDGVSQEDQDAVRQISYSALIDSNVESESVHLRQEPDHRAVPFYQQAGSPDLPALVLVSPHEEALHIEWRNNEGAFKDAVWSTMEYVIQSPFRQQLLEESIRSYGIVLLVEGKNPQANQRAEEHCKAAVEKAATGMDDLPKKIKNPPVFAKLERNRLEEEKLLLWSYGIDPTESDEPFAAIVYGRGRQIGRVLQGADITSENVLSVLSVIGLSCECGLDRSWMMGTVFPLVWNDHYRKLAMENVGFDTESPMVKTEISQIMSKGSTTQKSTGTPLASPDPLLGYAEVNLAEAGWYTEPISSETGADETRSADPSEASLKSNAASSEEPVVPADLSSSISQSSQTAPENAVLSSGVYSNKTSVLDGLFASSAVSTLVVVLGILGVVAVGSGLLVLWLARGKQA